MAQDDDFEPRLGRLRARGGRRSRTYLGRVLVAANLARAGSGGGAAAQSRFTGSRIGRGAGVGRLLARRGPAFSTRRVIVKASIVRLAGKGAGAAAAHLRYLQRDGTTRDGAPGALYGAETDRADGVAFRDRGRGDRHQFRFIVSAEDGADYADLKPLTRRLMTRVEQDLGTRLDWVAVDHFNTGHPHTHIVVRGKDDQGKDLVLARDYLTCGLRERACELVDLDLGPRSARAIEAARRAEVTQQRLTSLDRALLRDADRDRVVSAVAADRIEQALRRGRLATLARLGLAAPIGGAQWRLAEGLDETLRRIGERDDIIRTMQRDFAARGLARSLAEQTIYDGRGGEGGALLGRLVARGLADEHADRHYLIVDGIDGRSHFVAIGQGSTLDPVPEGAILRVTPRQSGVRAADRTIVAVAAANQGRYDIDAHLRHDPGATQDFAEAHVRRLEAMRRLGEAAVREATGQWIIADDHLDRVAAYEARLLRDRPVEIEVVADRPLAALVDADAATWLDRALIADGPVPSRDAGFGAELAVALERRRLWLVARGLAEGEGAATRYPSGLIATLTRRELARVAAQLADAGGLPFAEVAPGQRIEGLLRRRLDLASGRFAMIERARDFVLVPWRPMLERQIGKPVSGLLRADGISWSIGRGRAGPALS